MNFDSPSLSTLYNKISEIDLIEKLGKITQVVGMIIESNGPHAKLGDLCNIKIGNSTKGIWAEVVGFKDNLLLLMPLGDMAGVHAGCLVRNTHHGLRVPVGRALLGRILDATGKPLDEKGELDCYEFYPVDSEPPPALKRKMIDTPFLTGVRSIDSLLTMGIGQRIGIFAGSGVGKSTLMGMIARNGVADINVIALIGERGRELREFIENDLEEGLQKSVIICATSDAPAILRVRAAMTATAVAEYFRDQGLNVMFMMDSVTRFAMAQREIGLAVGEPPSTKGYTPSVFAALPKLMERTGCSSHGAITAIYTVLVEGDDTNEPIADTVRSILDGHIFLNRRLTQGGHYPPIDISQSLSRLMPAITSKEHIQGAHALREMIVKRQELEDLINIGAYQPGNNPSADRAVQRWDSIQHFLKQAKDEKHEMSQSLHTLGELTSA